VAAIGAITNIASAIVILFISLLRKTINGIKVVRDQRWVEGKKEENGFA